LCKKILDEELIKLKALAGDETYDKGRFGDASTLFLDLISAEKFPEFLTLPAYQELVAEGM
jgi:malate synthase